MADNLWFSTFNSALMEYYNSVLEETRLDARASMPNHEILGRRFGFLAFLIRVSDRIDSTLDVLPSIQKNAPVDAVTFMGRLVEQTLVEFETGRVERSIRENIAEEFPHLSFPLMQPHLQDGAEIAGEWVNEYAASHKAAPKPPRLNGGNGSGGNGAPKPTL